MKVPILSELKSNGKNPEYLFWIGCAGSFDDRAKKVTKAFIKILNSANTSYAILGKEESCTGDPAKRAGNEFLFQMQAVSNIKILNDYSFKKIVTTCPHCFNTLKNEYPELGGNYDVFHHTELLSQLISEGKKIEFETEYNRDFFGRILSYIIIDGENVSKLMVSHSLGVVYDKNNKKDWCE